MSGETFVYSLQLEDDFYYLGISTNPIGELRKHHRGSHPWTTLHKPERLISARSGTEQDLKEAVLFWMAKVGIDKVRGGPYQEVIIPEGLKTSLRIETRLMREKALTGETLP